MAVKQIIQRFTRSCIRRYSDTGHTIAYVEWVDTLGRPGRTEGKPTGAHMVALMNAADRQGAPFKYEVW